MKVAICGLAPSYIDAPWSDPEWEKWSLAWGHEYVHQSAKVFEMHDLSIVPDQRLESMEYIDSLVTQENYPLTEIINQYGDYFNCSVDYMIALAIHLHADEIGLWGVNASDKGHLYQRAGIEHWLGIAKGKGIKVTIHEDSPILKYQKPDEVRYGYL